MDWTQLVVFCVIESLALLNLPSSLHRLIPRIPLAYIFGGLILVLCLLALYLFARLRIFPDYYEIKEDGLFLSQGRKKIQIPYASLDRVLPTSQKSLNRLMLVPERGNTCTIAVAERERFLAELAKRCPQLEQKPTDFGLSLQRPLVFR
jgi:hypothetical protein